MSLEVSAEQKSTLDGMLAALPSEPTDEKLPLANKLAGLFYHPNTACRAMALVLSASFDAVGGRSESATKKLDRAIQVFTLVSDDTDGRKQLEGLREHLDGDLTGYLTAVHGEVVPYLEGRLVVPDAPAPKAAPMPRMIEDGESLPTEKRTQRARRPSPRRAPAPRVEAAPEPAEEEPQEEVAAPAAAPEEIAAAAPPADDDGGNVEIEASDAEPDVEIEAAADAEPSDEAPVSEDTADADSVGPSEAEAAAAAAAALAAMEAPFEEVVQDDAPPRFDPDRDLTPDDGRRRRRRSRRLEGLERPRPDQVATPRAEEPAPASTESADDADGDAESALELVRVARSGDVDSLAESALEALKLALRRAREAGLAGRLSVEVTIGPAGEEGEDGGGRRRRRRRRGRGRS